MTAPGYTVTTTELRDHASTVAQLADVFAHNAGSAQQATLGDQAYGQIAVATAFSQLIRAVAQPGISALSQAQATLNMVNHGITTTASNYDTIEQTNKSRFLAGGTGTAPNPLTGTVLPGNSTSQNPAAARNNNGANIVNDVNSLEKNISSGNWVQAGIAGLNIANDAAQILADPVSAVLRYGLNFLVQHVKPLQDAVHWLVGNAGQVSAYGNAWRGIAQSVSQASDGYAGSVAKDTANWTGQAASSYRSYATDKVNTLNAIATASRTIGNTTQQIGTVVNNVRGLIQNMVSQAMSQIIQTALAASFMITIPVVVARVVTEVLNWMRKIAGVIQQLTSTFNQLQGLMGTMRQLFGSINQSLGSGSQPLAAIAAQAVPGITVAAPSARTAPVGFAH